MTTMTSSINKVFKLIFHDLTPRYSTPPAPLNPILGGFKKLLYIYRLALPWEWYKLP